jgi:hypothetical protein
MQMQPSQGLSLADIPMGFFPDDVPGPPVAHRSAATPAPIAAEAAAKPSGAVSRRAIKLARAKTGETELRLLVEQDGKETRYRYVIDSSTIAPYVVKREVLVKPGKKKAPMNEQQAVEEFERRVALAYPPETLRNNKVVAIHLNLI